MVWTLDAIKVTVFALEPHALRQKKVFPMHRFALLAETFQVAIDGQTRAASIFANLIPSKLLLIDPVGHAGAAIDQTHF